MFLAAPGLAADVPIIKTRGHLIAGPVATSPPVSFLNDKNELTGYDIEVRRFIANHLGVKLDLVRLDWKGILPGLQTGRDAGAQGDVSTTRSRTHARRWSWWPRAT